VKDKECDLLFIVTRKNYIGYKSINKSLQSASGLRRNIFVKWWHVSLAL